MHRAEETSESERREEKKRFGVSTFGALRYKSPLINLRGGDKSSDMPEIVPKY